MSYPIKRTPEQGHTFECLAAAMICAIENERDALKNVRPEDVAGVSPDTHFRLWLQENGPLQEADSYLADGMTQCYCEPISQPEYVVTSCSDHGTKVASDKDSARVYIEAARGCRADIAEHGFVSHVEAYHYDSDCWVCCDKMLVTTLTELAAM